MRRMPRGQTESKRQKRGERGEAWRKDSRWTNTKTISKEEVKLKRSNRKQRGGKRRGMKERFLAGRTWRQFHKKKG